jgi:GMP synthase-like glutamine amidotransferase
VSSEPQVLVVQHVEQEHAGLIADVLAGLRIHMDVIRPDLGDAIPENPVPYSGIVLMGGPQSVHGDDQDPFFAREKKLVRSSIGLGVPILGICLGCQILAECLGGSVKSGNALEIGWLEVRKTKSADSDPLFQELPESFYPLHWHEDTIEVPPDCASFGSSATTAVQGFSFRGQCYGLLFHMEVTGQIVTTMCEAFSPQLATAGVSSAEILAASASKLHQLEPVARTFFGRWANLALALHSH